MAAEPSSVTFETTVAVTGSNVSPGLFESLELVGRDESLTRLDSALTRLS